MLRKTILLLLVFLMLCGFGPLYKGIVNLNEADSGRTIELKCGSFLDIVLEGNPTTGYIWSVTSKNSPVLPQIKGSEFKPQSKLIGSGGKFTFHFKAAKHGKTTLTLVYRRPWEKKPPVKTFRLNITVID
jgi:inhibitor of cysteine peptidase